MSPPPPRVALVGISGYGKIYLERILHHAQAGQLSLVAATVINAAEERACCAELESRGVRIYPQFRPLIEELAGRLDLVLLPTGIHWHAPMTFASLAAGANVLVEKPLAATVQEARRIGEAAAAAGRFVAVGFQDMYLDETLEVKRRLAAGALGKLRRIRGRGLWPRSGLYYGRNDWAGRIRIGDRWVLDSPLSNAFSHFLNLALFTVGASEREPARPAAIEAELYRARPIENYDTAAVRIATSEGVEILFYASHACARSLEPELRVDGESGEAHWTAESGWVLRRAGREERLPPRNETQARAAMFEKVLARVSDPRVFVCEPAVAAAHVLCFDGAQSAAEIRTVPAAFVRTSPTDPAQPVIAGLEGDVDRAFASGRLLHESGCPWADPPGRISLENFASFPP